MSVSKQRTMQRLILEMGMGADLHGKDYTKAAVRAVDDALRHSSINFRRALDVDASQLHVTVTIGVASPDAIDKAAVAARVPGGNVEVTTTAGGLDLPGVTAHDPAVVASAAVEVWLNRPQPANDA